MIHVHMSQERIDTIGNLMLNREDLHDMAEVLETVRFGDGYEADLKLCYGDDCSTWIETVWFHNGVQSDCSDCCDDVIGLWTDCDGHDFEVSIGEEYKPKVAYVNRDLLESWKGIELPVPEENWKWSMETLLEIGDLPNGVSAVLFKTRDHHGHHYLWRWIDDDAVIGETEPYDDVNDILGYFDDDYEHDFELRVKED